MTEKLWMRSHVERLLQDEWDVCRVVADDDGDYHFRSDTAVGWVSIVESDDPGPAPAMVRVWAVAATEVKATAAMWRELNDIQLSSLSSSVMWTAGRVIVSQTVSPVGLSGPVLAQAIDSVQVTADRVGPLIAGMYGGSTPLPASAHDTQDEQAW